MDTVFGFFPPAAFEDQAGLPVTVGHRALFELADGRPADWTDLTRRPTGSAPGRRDSPATCC